MNTTAKPHGTELAPITAFQQGLDKMRGNLATLLPSDVSLDRFVNVVKTAVYHNQDLLKCNRQSLYNACVKAAQDGLVPDGREAALVKFGTDVAYMPMISGLRKKAAKYGFDLIAQCVFKGDEFSYELGDKQEIVHRPPTLGMDRGDLIGCYAIATDLKTGIKYREVLSKADIEKVRNISKSKNSGPWQDWYDEQARKTACRRLFKQLPFYLEEDIQRIIDNENAEYELPPDAKAGQTAAPPAAAPQTLKEKMTATDKPAAAEPAATNNEAGGEQSGDLI